VVLETRQDVANIKGIGTNSWMLWLKGNVIGSNTTWTNSWMLWLIMDKIIGYDQEVILEVFYKGLY